jgi:hypothetical protein
MKEVIITHEFFGPERAELCTERRITLVSILALSLACLQATSTRWALLFLKITLLLQNATVD